MISIYNKYNKYNCRCKQKSLGIDFFAVYDVRFGKLENSSPMSRSYDNFFFHSKWKLINNDWSIDEKLISVFTLLTRKSFASKWRPNIFGASPGTGSILMQTSWPFLADSTGLWLYSILVTIPKSTNWNDRLTYWFIVRNSRHFAIERNVTFAMSDNNHPRYIYWTRLII